MMELIKKENIDILSESRYTDVYVDIPNNVVYKYFNAKTRFDREIYFMNLIDKNDNLKNTNNFIKYKKYDKEKKMIILPYIKYNLEKLIRKIQIIENNNKIDKNKLIKKIIDCMKQLHKNNIIHNDFRLKNIQMDENFNLIMIDFENSKEINKLKLEEKNKLLKQELNLLKFIIIQIVYNVNYKDAERFYKKENFYLNKFNNDYPELKDLFKLNQYNLDNLYNYFQNNILIK
jgi:serine/threonine protein kinase